jgi:glycosyltransferase involved in cell wall biosynthesis
MANAVTLVVAGNLNARTGGYIYDRHVVDGLRERNWSVDVRVLADSFPRPTAAASAHAERTFDTIRDGTVTLVDSLVLGAIPDIIERHGTRLRVVALMHLPLAADVGLDEDSASRFAVAERRALGAAAAVVVTGRATLKLLDSSLVSSSRVFVIEPGTDPVPLARGSGGTRIHLLCVATLNPGKGHEDLLSALAAIPSREWRLTCAGSLTRDPRTVERVRALTRDAGLDDLVSLTGELDGRALEAVYDRSDVFVLATLRETYGMAVAEALARGLPVVSTRTGAIPDLVGSEAGLLVAPGDVPALTDVLSHVLRDPALRKRLADGARRVRASLPGWDDMVSKMANTLESIGHG